MSHLKLVASATSSDSAAYYSEAFEQLDSGLCIIDGDGAVLVNNQAFCRLLDLPSDWASPKAAKRSIPASEKLATGWLARVALEGGFAETVALSGGLTLRVVGKVLPSGGVSLTLTETTDNSPPIANIANSAAARQSRRNAEERFRGVVENMADIYFHADLSGKTTLGMRAIGRLLGYAPEEFAALDWRDLHLNPNRRAKFLEELDRNGGQIRDFEIAVRHKNGKTVWLSSNARYRYGDDGKLIGLEGVARDISEQKSTQESLRRSEAGLRQAQRLARIGHWERNLVNGEVFWSDAIFEFLGIEKGPVPGFEAALKNLHPDDRDILSDTLSAIYDGKAYQEIDFRVVAPSGEVRHLHEVLEADFDGQGCPTRCFGVVQDVTEARRAEQALRESEQRFRTLIDNLPAGITLKDTDHNILLVNRRLEEWYGIQADDFIGKNFDEAQIGSDGPSYIDQRQNFVQIENAVSESGKPIVSELTIPFADGTEHDLQITSFANYDTAGDIVSIGTIGFDMTEQNRVRNALRESDARFRSLVDNLPNAVSLQSSEQRFILVNKSFESLVNRTQASLVGQPLLSSMVDHDDWQSIVAGDRDILDGARTNYDATINLTFDDGVERTVELRKFPVADAAGKITAVGTISTDITDRVVAEQALRESEARFRALIDNLPAGVILKDHDHNIVLANGWVGKWHGVPVEEFIGKKFSEVMLVPHDADFVHGQQAVIDNGESVETEFRVTFADGSEHFLQTIFFPVNSGDGEYINVGIVSFDITERKRTEEMLLQAQKMEVVGQLTGGVAHDFNNLLAVVIGNLEMVTDHLQADAPPFEYVRNAFNAAERGASLTHQLLAFSRQQVLRPEPTDLERLIFETKELMSISMGEKIVVELHAGDNLWRCKVDQAQLQNAILNLSINARDAMPSGGHMTISAENAVIDAERADVLELNEGGYVCLSVSDTGAGIPEETLEHVYEPFFTTKDVGEGSGLGLSMVYGFARQSGGCVDIETAEGEGTTVSLYIPAIAPDGAIADEIKTKPRDGLTEPDATIMLVEDNADFREITRTILESLNFRVIDFGTAEEALAVIGDTTGFDLLLTDVGLPGRMNGHDLAGYAASARPGLKIVLMSARADWELNGSETDRDVSAFLHKPYRRAELAQTLRRLLDINT